MKQGKAPVPVVSKNGMPLMGLKSNTYAGKVNFGEDAKVKGDILIRIGEGLMDCHFNTSFLDPSQKEHKITLNSAQLNGEKKPCVGASPELRAKGLKVEITFKKINEIQEADKTAFEAWIQQADLWKQIGLFDDQTADRLGLVAAGRRRLTTSETKHIRKSSLGKKESITERLARLEGRYR